MCGIAGILREDVDLREQEQLLCQMSDSLRSRGPDDSGRYLEPGAALLHRRLAIIDPAGGRQPMRFGDLVIAYNGEIYNTAQVRHLLESAGYSFETTCDTEVVLKAYHKWKAGCLEKLNGIFAFAVYDTRRGTLFAARDRIGVKPLFYCKKGRLFAFASRIPTLLLLPEVEPVVDRSGLAEIFMLGPARSPGHAVFRDLAELPPACYLTYDHGTLQVHRYWKLHAAPHTDSPADTIERTHQLVTDAVERQLVSDVPVCTFLSGGIDSSIVTAIAANYMNTRGKTLNTFSFDFKDNDRYFKANAFQPERDLLYVNRMLEEYETAHSYLECDENSLFKALFAAVDAKDMPGMTDVDSSLLYFCSLVSRKNKVALTGECADEIFGGYPWFYRKELLERYGFPWSSDVAPRLALLRDDVGLELDLSGYQAFRYEESRSKAPLLYGEAGEDESRRIIGYLNIKWFMQTLLDRMDRTSMYSELEARVPFADHRIIEYVFNVPWHMKYQNGVEKTLLRDAFSDVLPPELLHRKKSPYPKTYHPGYEALLIKGMEEILDSPNAPVRTLIDADKTREFLKAPAEYGSPWFGQLMAGPQLIAYFIQINYWMEKYQLSV